MKVLTILLLLSALSSPTSAPTTAPAQDSATQPAAESAQPAETAAQRGTRDAHADIARGRLAFRVAGLPDVSTFAYWDLLKSRLGVEIEGVAGCIVDEEIVESLGAYNKVMEAEIKRRHGKNVLKRLREEAQQRSASGK